MGKKKLRPPDWLQFSPPAGQETDFFYGQPYSLFKQFPVEVASYLSVVLFAPVVHRLQHHIRLVHHQVGALKGDQH